MDNPGLFPQPATPDVRALRARIAGDVVTPSDEEWDEARQAWHLAVDQQPEFVAIPESAEDLVAVVEFARDHGYRVAPQATGHDAPALGDLSGTILVKTHRMRGVTIYTKQRKARVEAGVLWIEVVEAAAEYGLAALAGSSPDVGVVGYTLGGGLSWLARKHGIGANQVTAVEIVTADGELVRATRENDPDLFWAVRGGGGNFGVVAAIEFNLFPISEVYAGILWYPVERAGEMLRAWREWTDEVPDEMTSVGRILQFPPIPEIPAPVRGQSFVVVEAIWLGDEDEGAVLLEPLRALGPVMDTVAMMPVEGLLQLHMDPAEPVAGLADGAMVDDVDDELIERLVATTVGTPLLSVEIRQLGGAVGRPRPEHGALASFDAPFVVFSVGSTPTLELYAAVRESIEALRKALAPWESEHTYLNLAQTKRDSRTLFAETAYHRLRRVKATYDPANMIRSNHELEEDERFC
jgi:FAD/FMN-containing dehydrogenase